MFRYDAALFDMDGTLLDTAEDISDALNHALSGFGYPTHTQDAIKGFLGNGAYQLVERALPELTDGAEIKRVLAAYRLRYNTCLNVRTRPYPGVLPMLAALHEAGLKLAVISNKGDGNIRLLAEAHFGGLIRVAVGARDGVPLKPAPDMPRAAMRRLGVHPGRALFVGDSAMDFHAAQNAGTDCILAHWGYGDPKALSLLKPQCFANDPAELTTLILQQQEGST
jgi:phosphoglycolate phosphatase